MSEIGVIIVGVLVVICAIGLIVISRKNRECNEHRSHVENKSTLLICEVDDEIRRVSALETYTVNCGYYIAELKQIKGRIESLPHIYVKNIMGNSMQSSELTQVESYFRCLLRLDLCCHYGDENMILQSNVTLIQKLLIGKKDSLVASYRSAEMAVYNEARSIVDACNPGPSPHNSMMIARLLSRSTVVISKLLHIELFS